MAIYFIYNVLLLSDGRLPIIEEQSDRKSSLPSSREGRASIIGSLPSDNNLPHDTIGTMTIRQLHKIFTPQHYKLHLSLQRIDRHFAGTVTIAGFLPKMAQEIVLHAKELSIQTVTIDKQQATWKRGTLDELILTTGHALLAGDHSVHIEFSGNITDTMNGLYPSYFTLDGQAEELLTTQFESNYAREVFPCVDEPAAKAIFDLTLTTEKKVTVIANTPIKQQIETKDALETTFETTPLMSTYLLAWVVGKLEYTEATTKHGVLVRAYATPDKVNKTLFALETGVRLLDFYDDYFGVAYPLPKCDMVALPDFSAGAMENWGCITYRENCLLIDEDSVMSSRQYVAMVIAHELAHQWFGNLVTMKWWNDLWLNESFATWMAYSASDQLFPEWQVWTNFYTKETMRAFDRDSLANIQPVRQQVDNPQEIPVLFDGAIVYAKGASLLRMLHAYLGFEQFRDGLRRYITLHQYANADTQDLWEALSYVTQKNINEFMWPWITQPGHPLLTVDISERTVVLHQRRFYNNPKQAALHDATTWPIPLLANTSLPTEQLTDPSTTTESIAQSNDPLLLNYGRTGFYLTMYSREHLQRITQLIRTDTLSVFDRLGLLYEGYELARAGQQSTKQLLELLDAYQKETSQPVWSVIATIASALRMLINEDPAFKPYLQQFEWQLIKTQFERLGWKRKLHEPYLDELLRPIIIAMSCYSENTSTIEYAQQLFTAAQQPEDILSDIRTSVLAVNVKFGGQPAFHKVLTWYKQTSSAELRVQLAAGLAAIHDKQHIQQLLALLTTKTIKPQDFFYWFNYLLRSHAARQLTWEWMQDNWAWIEKMFGNDLRFSDLPRYSADAFSERYELALYRQFFEPLLHNSALTRSIKLGMELIEAKAQWRERDLTEITDYLKNATKITS